MKRYSVSLAIRKTQVKTTMRYHFPSTRMAVIKRCVITSIGKAVRKLVSSDIAGGNVTLVQPLWKTFWEFLKWLSLELPYDPTIPFLRIYPREMKTYAKICALMFIAAVVTIVKW